MKKRASIAKRGPSTGKRGASTGKRSTPRSKVSRVRPRTRSNPTVARTARRTTTDRHWTALARYAVAMSRQDQPGAARAVRDARRGGMRRVAVEETALMLMLYSGYPAALEGLRVLNKTWPGRARAGHEGTTREWLANGRRLCGRVYGDAYPRLLANVRGLHPHLARWMVEHGYGRVLARRGLSARHRELITVSVLASSAWKRQLHSHLLGAAHVGASPAEIRRALAIGLRGATTRTVAAVRRAWRLAFEDVVAE